MGKLYRTPPTERTTVFELTDRWGDRYSWIGQSHPLIRFAEEGYIPDGIVTDTTLHPELQGMPTFRGLRGPIYGGDRDGMLIVKYEDEKNAKTSLR